jgi:hypothetical protein
MCFLHRRPKPLSQRQGASMRLDALCDRQAQIVFQQRHVAPISLGGFPRIRIALAARRFHGIQFSAANEHRQAGVSI